MLYIKQQPLLSSIPRLAPLPQSLALGLCRIRGEEKKEKKKKKERKKERKRERPSIRCDKQGQSQIVPRHRLREFGGQEIKIIIILSYCIQRTKEETMQGAIS